MTYAESGASGIGFELQSRGRGAASVEIAELTHEEVRGQLTDFLASELDETSTARVADHLGQCAPCAAYLATLRATVGLLGTLPTRPAPDALRRRLLAIPNDESAARP